MAQEIGRWKLRVPEGGDGPAHVPTWLQRLATDLSDVAKDGQGPLAARPVSTTLQPSNTPGRYWFVTGDPDAAQNRRLYRDTGSGWEEIPVGPGQRWEVGDYKLSAQPSDHGDAGGGAFAWLRCDTREVSTAHPQLVAFLQGAGAPFGTGPGGRPRLPDAAGRAVMIAGSGAGLTTRALGAKVGTESHTLTVAQIPAHAHGVNDPGHSHNGANGFQAGSSYPDATTGAIEGYTFPTSSSATGISIQSAGSGQSHPNLQPSIAAGYLFIRAV